jgi:plasmid stability protein
MANITVKNIPDELYTHLKQSARQNQRSINSEVIVCLKRALGSQKISPDTVLRRARQLRQMTQQHPVTDAQFTRAKAAGRR